MHALIVGGSRGIGRATAARLLAADWQVTVMARRAVAGIEDTGAAFYTCDVADSREVAAAFAHMVREQGAPSVLIFSAGAVFPGPILDVNPFLVDWHFRVNTIGGINCAREFVNLGGGGLLLFLGSTASHRPTPQWAAYGAAKAALLHFSKTLAHELPESPLFDVVTVSPGRTATDLRQILAPAEDSRAIQQPEQVAKAISFILDEWFGNPAIARFRGAEFVIADGDLSRDGVMVCRC